MRRSALENDLFDEKLEWFKKNEKPETVLVVGEDEALTKIVLAWSNITVRRISKLSPLTTDTESEVWQWLWKNAQYSREELIAKSVVYDRLFDRKLELLIGNRVLYPDGTMNSFVQRYLREKVLKLFDAKPKRAKRKLP